MYNRFAIAIVMNSAYVIGIWILVYVYIVKATEHFKYLTLYSLKLINIFFFL